MYIYLYGSIRFLSSTQKHDMLILVRSHWAGSLGTRSPGRYEHGQ